MIPAEVVERLVASPGLGVSTLEESGMLDPDHVDALLQAAAELAHTDLDATARLLDVIEAAPVAARSAAVTPAAAYLRARVLVAAGEPERALALIDTAREGYEGLGLIPQALRTVLGRMHVLDDLGRHDEAFDLGTSLLDTLSAADGTEELTQLAAAVHGNLGVALGFRGRHTEALEAYRLAEAAWRELGQAEEATTAVANQGVELLAMGQAGEALDCLDAALAVSPAGGDQEWLGKLLGHRGAALSALGRHVEALADFQQARSLLDAVGAGTEVWRLSVETATTFLSLGLWEEAVTVVALVEQNLRDARLDHDLATALAVAGRAHLRRESLEEATPALAEAAELYRAVGDTPSQARALLDLSRTAPVQEARALAGSAALLLQNDRWPGVRCMALLRLAELAEDDPDLASGYLREASRLADALHLPHLSLAVSQSRGALRQRLGDVEGAISSFEEALALVEGIGTALADEDLRMAYLASTGAATEGLIQALIDRGSPQDVERAATVADAAKGRSLIDVLRGALRPRTAAADKVSVGLQGALNAAYSALLLADPQSREQLHSRINSLEQQIAVRTVLAPNGRRRARSTGSGGPAAAVPTVAYHVVGATVHAFVPLADGTHAVRQLTDVDTLTRLIDDLDAHLGNHASGVIARYGAARAPACRRILQQLYLEVFAPVRDLLPTSGDDAELGLPPRLQVIPHGPTHRVPFHALHDGRRYLVERYRISVAPSIAAAQLAAAQSRPARRLVIVGVGDEAGRHIEEEARAIAAVVGDCILLVGPDAALDRVRSAMEQASLVHLSCHGLFRQENPAFSSLRLADRWVRAADLADVSLDGAVLVLSGCETARVGVRDGDEAVGLARSFLAAGAQSVVVSQWVADDRCTAELMTRLHRRMAAGQDPATALREAQLETMTDYPHPYHWAPFIAVGAPCLLTEN